MLRHKWLATFLTLSALCVVAVPAPALPFVSFYASGVVGGQSQEVTLDVAGMESFEGTSGIVLYGVDAGVGLPMGFHFDGHYYRHTNEFGEDLAADSGFDAFVDMAGNEWGASLEWHLGLIPASPVKPFIGAGGSYSRINLDGEIRFEGESEALETDTDLYRIYALAGLKLTSLLRATVHAGMTFGETDAAEASYTLAGQTVSVTADYQGYYVAGAVSLGF